RRALIGSRSGDGSAAIGVAHEEDGAANAVQRPLHHSQVLFKRFQAVLNCDHLIAIRLQCGDDLAEARAIGPNAVAEHDGWFALQRHRSLLSLVGTTTNVIRMLIRCARFILVNKYFVCQTFGLSSELDCSSQSASLVSI